MSGLGAALIGFALALSTGALVIAARAYRRSVEAQADSHTHTLLTALPAPVALSETDIKRLWERIRLEMAREQRRGRGIPAPRDPHHDG